MRELAWIANARLRGYPEPIDLQLSDGRISAMGRQLRREGEGVDAGGMLVTPSFIEPHCHLDAALTAGQPRPNASGTLWEGIALWSEIKPVLDQADVYRRAHETLRWMASFGITHVRSHVDICDASLTALRALVRLREDVRDWMDLQLVAFPQEGIFGFPDGEALMHESIALGVDALGAIPHYEMTREDGVRSVQWVMALAKRHGLLVDVHCDEIDDEQSRFVEVLAAETIRQGMSGRTTASHLTASHSYNGAYASKLISLMRRAGLHVVTNPLDNAVLQGRFDHYPIRRGHARVKEMLAAGLQVACGHDSVMDPWYPMGAGDPLKALFVLMHYVQIIGAAERPVLFEMATTMAAAVHGLADHGVHPGAEANLILWDVPSEDDALRLLPPRRMVLKRGRVVAQTQSGQTRVLDEPVSYLHA